MKIIPVPSQFHFLDGFDRDLQQNILKQLKIIWTYSSNALEGNTISIGDTEFIIEEGLTIAGKTIKEHNEVVGHARAIDILYTMLEKNEISKEDLFSLHKAIQTEQVVDVYCPVGNWKNEVNGTFIRVDGKRQYHEYPHPDHIPHLMEIWFKQFGTNKKEQDLNVLIEKYAAMHLGFVQIHPFFDGNGRMARLISNIPLLQSGFPPITISKENRKQYLFLLSMYETSLDQLNAESTSILERENEYFQKFCEFCKEEYREIQNLIEEAREIQNRRK